MASTTVAEVQAAVRAYLEGSMTVDDLDDWLDAHTWNMDPTADPEAYALSRDVELVIADFLFDMTDVDGVDEGLRELLPPTWSSEVNHLLGWGDNGPSAGLFVEGRSASSADSIELEDGGKSSRQPFPLNLIELSSSAFSGSVIVA